MLLVFTFPRNSHNCVDKLFFSKRAVILFFVSVFIIAIHITGVFRDANQAVRPIMADQVIMTRTVPET